MEKTLSTIYFDERIEGLEKAFIELTEEIKFKQKEKRRIRRVICTLEKMKEMGETL